MKVAAKRKTTKRQTVGKKDTYHGVPIPEPEGTSNFTDEELRRAVDAAVEKNRHLFTPYK